MRVIVVGAATLALLLLAALLLAAPATRAQTPTPPAPIPGFITSHEVTRIVRSAGFDPLAPPLREGTTYVLRATDFRGILMRVVVDARSGAIRAVNRIVAGPGSYGPPIGIGPYGFPEGSSFGIGGGDEIDAPEITPPNGRTAAHPLASPPLPRPRPPTLAARKPAEARPGDKPGAMSEGASTATVVPEAPNKPALVPLND